MVQIPVYSSQVDSVKPVLDLLNRENVRYIVVGGLAVVLHGHVRLTRDVDLIVDLEPNEAKRALAVLTSAGFRPRAPVDASDFADSVKRESWIREKNMTVFSLFDPSNPFLEIDLFVSHPIDFEDLWARSQIMSLGKTEVRVASIDDLIGLKRLSGRPQDLADIKVLEEIKAEPSDEV